MITPQGAKLIMDFFALHHELLADAECHKLFSMCWGVRVDAGEYKQ